MFTSRHLLAALLLGLSGMPQASPLQFDIQIATNTLNGTSGFLGLDLVDGDGLVNNQVTIDAFTTDGTLGALVLTGDVSGDLAASTLFLGDTSFFNEALQEITFGDAMSFRFSITGEGPCAPFPDAFSLFLLDDTFFPFETNDPTGADALVIAEISSAGPNPVAFDSAFANAVISPAQIPAPPVVVLVAMGLGLIALTRVPRKR